MPSYLKYPLLAIKVAVAFVVTGICMLLAIFIGFDYQAKSFQELLINEFWIAIKPILFLLPAVCLIDFFVEKNLRKILMIIELIIFPIVIVLLFTYSMAHWYFLSTVADGFQNIGYERSSGRFPDQGPNAGIFFYTHGKTYGEIKSIAKTRVVNANNNMSRLFFNTANPITFYEGGFNDSDVLTNNNELGAGSAGW